MRNRSPAIHAQQYLTLVARAYTDAAGEPPPAAVRTNFVTLYRHAPGVKVQAWFRRRTESGVPELRIGVTFDLNDELENARRAEQFAARFPAELAALGAEEWPGETGLDRRLMTGVLLATTNTLDRVIAKAVMIAQHYAALIVRPVIGTWPRADDRTPR